MVKIIKTLKGKMKDCVSQRTFWAVVGGVSGTFTLAFISLTGYVIANDGKRESDKICLIDKMQIRDQMMNNTLIEIMKSLEVIKTDIKYIKKGS